MRGTFYLNKQDGKLMGVCAGLADYTGWDATLIRVGLVVATLAGGFPWTLIAYVVAGFVFGTRPYGLGETAASGDGKVTAYDLRQETRDIDRRLAEVDDYVANSSGQLAREIEELR